MVGRRVWESCWCRKKALAHEPVFWEMLQTRGTQAFAHVHARGGIHVGLVDKHRNFLDHNHSREEQDGSVPGPLRTPNVRLWEELSRHRVMDRKYRNPTNNKIKQLN